MSDRLAEFEQRKKVIIGFAERLRGLAQEGRDPGTAQVLDEFMGTFRNNRFLLLVVGDFKSGKSTLVNALVERAICPVKATPRTAKVTRLSGTSTPDETDRVEITFREDRPVERRSLEGTTLDDLVALNGSLTNQVQLVDVHLKSTARLLKHPVRLVDTPGLGSGEEEHSRITREYMHHADALLFVFSAVKPFSDSERDFLLTFRTLLDRTIFVVNQMDRVPEEEREDVVQHIRASVERDVFGKKGSPGTDLFQVSAYAAMSGLRKQDPQLLKESGVPALVEAIERRLADAHATRMLRTITDQQLQVCSILSERASLAADGLASSSLQTEAMKPRLRQLRDELRRMAAKDQPIREGARANEQRWLEAAGPSAHRIRDGLLESISQWIDSCPSEEVCKKQLPAELARQLTDRLEQLDRELAHEFAGAAKEAYAAQEKLFGEMEGKARSILAPGEGSKKLSGGMGRAVGALSGLTALAQQVGGPTGGYGVATAALAQALAPSASVRFFSVTAAVSLLLAGVAGPVGWVIAGVTSIVAAFLGFSHSSSWRERVRANVRQQVDEQLVQKVDGSIRDSVAEFFSGLTLELQERSGNVLSRLDAVVEQVASEVERELKERQREITRLRTHLDAISKVRAELSTFGESLPSLPAAGEAGAPPEGKGTRGGKGANGGRGQP